MMKKRAIAVAAAVLIGGGAYFGSPYVAARELRAAARAGDADRLDAEVDFPAVRAGLKAQLSGAITRKIAGDRAMQDNPFAGLGMLMIPAIIDKAVDAYVTPDGIAAMVRGARPGERDAADGAREADVRVSCAWLTLDRFRVTTVNAGTGQAGPGLIFERRGLVSWKLVRIDLGESLPGR